MTVEIRIARDNDAPEWDSIISRSSQGTPFHLWNWLKLTEKHTQSTLYPLVGLKNNVPIGVFPLFFQKKGPVRMVFSPPPHAALFHLGPVFLDYDRLSQERRESNYHEFQHSAEKVILHDLKANFISISLSPALQDPRPFIWSGYSAEIRYDYVIDLSRGGEYLLQTIDKKLRQNLNRAKKRGMTIEIGGKKEYALILDLMDIRYGQQGKHVTVSREYLLDIYDAYKDNLKIFVAKVDNEVITGSIDLQYGKTHYSWIGSPKPKNSLSPSPNDLLMWESVRIAQEQGFRFYVTMGAAGNKRLHSYFASKFDPELKVYFSMKKNSFLTGLFEKGYTNVIKPFRGKVKRFMSRENPENHVQP
jgi:CelD/BcsL family acetyltransferase involved in cellulose biosynthesis